MSVDSDVEASDDEETATSAVPTKNVRDETAPVAKAAETAVVEAIPGSITTLPLTPTTPRKNAREPVRPSDEPLFVKWTHGPTAGWPASLFPDTPPRPNFRRRLARG